MTDKEVRVREHTRRVKSRSKDDQAYHLELPSIAPDKGTKIIDAKSPEAKRETARGVTRVGGGDYGRVEKGVTRVGRNR